MRKLNAILSALILVLFLFHAIPAAFNLTGFGASTAKTAAWICLILIALHAAIGIKLTWDTLRIQKKSGAAYFRENKLFWLRRISGLAMMIFIILHLFAFGQDTEAGYRLKAFNTFRLTTQLLFVASLALHIFSNIQPLLISLGMKKHKEKAADILLVLGVILVFLAAALGVYYLRWLKL